MKEFLRKEPAIIFMAVRLLLLVLAAVGLDQWLTEDVQNQLLAFVGALLAIDVGTTVATRANVYSPSSVTDIATSASVATPSEPAATTAGAYVVSLVKNLLPIPQLPMGLKVVSDLAVQYGNAQLTPELRKDIQRKVHLRLRQAGLLRGRDFPPVSMLFIGLLVLLVSCTPASRFAVGGLNELAGDSAVLQWAERGVVYHPGEAAAVGVILELLGESLVLDEVVGQPQDTCTVEEDATAVLCVFPLVAEPVTVNLEQGLGVTAAVTYRRTPEGRPYSEFLTD